MTTAQARHAQATRRLKCLAIVLCCLPAAWMVLRWVYGDRLGLPLGPRPVPREMHLAGIWTLRLLLVTLTITPLRAITGWHRAIVVRRILGVSTALYGMLHFTLFVIARKFDFAAIADNIVHRRFLTLGLLALLGLVVLAVTSTDGWLRRLGRRWATLHRGVFVIAVLGMLHFFMQKKFDVSEPCFYAGLLAWLLIWRLLPRRQAGDWRVLAAMLVASVLATWAIEYLWYEIATTASAWSVVRTEFDWHRAPRPGAQVAIAGALVMALGTAASLVRPATRRPTSP